MGLDCKLRKKGKKIGIKGTLGSMPNHSYVQFQQFEKYKEHSLYLHFLNAIIKGVVLFGHLMSNIPKTENCKYGIFFVLIHLKGLKSFII